MSGLRNGKELSKVRRFLEFIVGDLFPLVGQYNMSYSLLRRIPLYPFKKRTRKLHVFVVFNQRLSRENCRGVNARVYRLTIKRKKAARRATIINKVQFLGKTHESDLRNAFACSRSAEIDTTPGPARLDEEEKKEERTE